MRESPLVLLSGTNLGIHAIHSPIKILLSHLDSYKTQYKYLEKLEQKCRKINLAQGHAAIVLHEVKELLKSHLIFQKILNQHIFRLEFLYSS